LNRNLALFLALFALLAATRLCHVNVLWAEETLPLAAAGEMQDGRALYRDIWFDKPPLAALIAWTAGGKDGVWLRVEGALYALLCCWLAWGFARDLWGGDAGIWAAGLLGFFLIFDFPAATIPLASDMLLLAPHLAAVWMAWRGRPWLAGALAGVGLLASPKGVLVLCSAGLLACTRERGSRGRILTAFLAVTGASVLLLWLTGTLPSYWEEVWRWGSLYAGTTFLEHPILNGLERTANWTGFHAALICGAVSGGRPLAGQPGRYRSWILWIALSAISVAAGMRFFPRYYLALLPPLVLLAANGLRRRPWIALLLAIPLVRFAPTYLEAAHGGWRDTAMDADSRAVAAILKRQAHPGETLFVWGYRPEIYVYSGLRSATRYLDSQPLTGVPADRHLTQSAPVETADSRVRRQELAATRPHWIVDGLGLYNPKLAITAFPDLQPWLAHYREAARSGNSTILELVR